MRVDGQILWRAMLELLAVELHVLVGEPEFFQRPRNARAGAAWPGIKLDCHCRLLSLRTNRQQCYASGHGVTTVRSESSGAEGTIGRWFVRWPDQRYAASALL